MNKCEDRLVDKYLNQYDAALKLNKKEDFLLFMNTVKACTDLYDIFENFIVGYSGSDKNHSLDLIKLSKNMALNIELRHITDIKKIEKDLKRNYVYLSQDKSQVMCFVYVADYDEFYSFNGESIKLCSCEELVKSMKTLDEQTCNESNKSLNRSKCLVSPFNHTEDFAKDRYYLTAQQEEIRNHIIKTVYDGTGSLISISGDKETGKSLLIHDIAKYLISGEKPIALIHCGSTGEGHYRLKSMSHWPVYKVEEFFESLIMGDIEFDVAVFDDAHLLDQYHFDAIKELIEEQGKKIILSTDKNQDIWEHEAYKSFNSLTKYDWSKCYDLSNKIKTSLEIVAFMSCVFNKNKPAKKLNYNNIEFSFFTSCKEIKRHISSLKARGWRNFYLSACLGEAKLSRDLNILNEKPLANEMEEEFEKVAVVMDGNFVYNQDGKLMVACNTNYQAPMYLHKIMTRTRRKIHFIIVDNEPLLEHLLDIIERDPTLKG